MTRPLVAIPADLDGVPPFAYHRVGSKYVDGVVHGADAQVALVPAGGDAPMDRQTVVERFDGLFLTGALSNVEPHHYDGPAFREGVQRDPDRDLTTLPLIRAAIDSGMPVFAVCRGIQELNVALGGSLHAHLEEVDGRFDHRSDKSVPMGERYGPRHSVHIVEGGLLEALYPGRRTLDVNSLHGQGLDRIAADLRIEARAEDGTVEAVSVPAAVGFVLGVQWHPEWDLANNADYRRLFAAFGEACRARVAQRRRAA